MHWAGDSNADSKRAGRQHTDEHWHGRSFERAAVPGHVRTRCTELVSEISNAVELWPVA